MGWCKDVSIEQAVATQARTFLMFFCYVFFHVHEQLDDARSVGLRVFNDLVQSVAHARHVCVYVQFVCRCACVDACMHVMHTCV